jgi:hypothetical protein
LFIEFIQALDRDKSFDYLQLLNGAIEERIKDSKLQQVLQISLLENLLESIGYEHKGLMKILLNKYENFASLQTLNNLSNLGEFSIDLVHIQDRSISEFPGWKKKLWDKYFLSQISFPDLIHKKTIKTLYKIVFWIKPNHRWNTKWK